MFKPVHGLRGTLKAPVLAGDNSFLLDDASMGLLRARLPTGDHTYALVRSGSAYEVVKITGAYQTAQVDRAQDGTIAQAFSAGAEVEFVLGENAIADIIEEKSLGELQLTGTGAAQVTKLGPNSYEVYVPEITLTSETEDIIVEGEYPSFVISAPVKSDCCD